MNWLVLVCIVALTAASAPSAFAQVESFTAQSQLIFRGTVVRVGAATLREVTPDSRTIVARVDEVLRAPPITGVNYAGREITVRLSDSSALRADEQFVFFTTAWLFGDGVGVHEVARLADTTALRTQIFQVVADQPGAMLQRRLAGAELVISARVSAVRPAPAKVREDSPGEHAPDWWEADLAVQSLEKGTLANKTLVILFPNSNDIIWQDSPKFRANQQGIWILRSERAKGRPTFGYFMALDPLDFQPEDQLARIRKFLQ